MDTKKLRQKILDLAIRGKLVPQDPNDEPASVLLERIRVEKQQLIKEGKIKAPKGSKACDTSHYEKIEGPFEIPESWEWCTLGEIGIWQAGGTPNRSHKEYYEGTIPWLKTGDLNDGIVTEIPECISQDAIENSSAKLNPAGSVLIAMYGATIGKLGILSFPATTNQACCACIEYPAVEQMFLFYFLFAHKDDFIRLGGGGAQPNISKDIIVKTAIPIPPKKEQQRIVSEIQKYFNLIDLIDSGESLIAQSISNFKAKILSLAISGKLVPQDPTDESAIELLKRINPDFKPCDNSHYENLPDGWTICRMGDVIRLISGTSYDKSDVQESGIKILRGGNVQDGEILERDDDVYVQMSREIAECNVRVGDIVIVASTGSADLIGKAGYIRKEYKYTQIGAFLRIARPIIRELSPYLNLIFSSEIYRSHIRVKAKGTNINNIKAAYINDFVIPLPPIDEQVRIVAAVKTYFGIIREIKAAL